MSSQETLALLGVISSVAFFVIGFIAFFGLVRTRANVAFTVFLISYCLWTVGFYFFIVVDDVTLINVILPAGQVCAVVTVLAIYYWQTALYDRYERNKTIIRSLGVVAAILIPLFFTDVIWQTITEEHLREIQAGTLTTPITGPLHPLFVFYILTTCLCAIFEAARAWLRHSEPRMQAIGMYSFLAMISVVVFFAIPNFLASYFQILSSQYNPALIIFVLLISYAMFRVNYTEMKSVLVVYVIAILLSLLALEMFFIADPFLIIARTFFIIVFLVFARLVSENFHNEVVRAQELEQLAENLEHANQQEKQQRAALEDTAKQLRAANEKLQKLDDAKSEFIAIASHQLRTPLTAVKGYLSLIREGTFGTQTEALQNVHQKMHTANERLISLVEDLLDITRLDAGKMQYHFETVNVQDMLKSLYDDFALQAKEKEIAFTINFSSSVPVCLSADRTKLRAAIADLVDNAIRYTHSGFVRLSVTSNHATVSITVEDTGIGIAKEFLPHLFTKFVRGKQHAKIHVDGIGLGLYAAKRIIDDHHGTIRVRSDGEGRGATFIVELPIVHGSTKRSGA